MKPSQIQVGNRYRIELENGTLKTTTAELHKILGFNGRRWNDYEDILQTLARMEGKPVAEETASEMIGELLAEGMLGQRVHPTYKHLQFIVA